jgi:Helix-turn-helix domain
VTSVARRPPRKRVGVPTGRRRLDGAVLDIAGVALLLGTTEKCVRAQIARGRLPARRLGSRIVVLREELLARLRSLPRVVEVTR